MVPELVDVAEKLRNARPVEPVTVRTFLGWFGAQRRGFQIMRYVREELANVQVETNPDFEDRWIDALISFQLVSTPESGVTAEPVQGEGDEPLQPEPAVSWITRDPTYRISKLAAANQKVISVAPDAPFAEVVTLLMARDFSQLPVMTNSRNVKGVVSWKAIGTRLALGQSPKTANDMMEDHHEVRAGQSIFEAIPLIRSFDYVIVRADDQTISGIVTGSDLASQFYTLSEPFLLLSEIENSVRNMIGGNFTSAELFLARDPGDARPVNGVDDLTFGEYLRLLQNPHHWLKLDIAIDRVLFCKDLDEVRLIRNNVTHFDPDGITIKELEILRDYKAFLQNLSRIVG